MNSIWCSLVILVLLVGLSQSRLVNFNSSYSAVCASAQGCEFGAQDIWNGRVAPVSGDDVVVDGIPTNLTINLWFGNQSLTLSSLNISKTRLELGESAKLSVNAASLNENSTLNINFTSSAVFTSLSVNSSQISVSGNASLNFPTSSSLFTLDSESFLWLDGNGLISNNGKSFLNGRLQTNKESNIGFIGPTVLHGNFKFSSQNRPIFGNLTVSGTGLFLSGLNCSRLFVVGYGTDIVVQGYYIVTHGMLSVYGFIFIERYATLTLGPGQCYRDEDCVVHVEPGSEALQGSGTLNIVEANMRFTCDHSQNAVWTDFAGTMTIKSSRVEIDLFILRGGDQVCIQDRDGVLEVHGAQFPVEFNYTGPLSLFGYNETISTVTISHPLTINLLKYAWSGLVFYCSAIIAAPISVFNFQVRSAYHGERPEVSIHGVQVAITNFGGLYVENSSLLVSEGSIITEDLRADNSELSFLSSSVNNLTSISMKNCSINLKSTSFSAFNLSDIIFAVNFDTSTIQMSGNSSLSDHGFGEGPLIKFQNTKIIMEDQSSFHLSTPITLANSFNGNNIHLTDNTSLILLNLAILQSAGVFNTTGAVDFGNADFRDSIMKFPKGWTSNNNITLANTTLEVSSKFVAQSVYFGYGDSTMIISNCPAALIETIQAYGGAVKVLSSGLKISSNILSRNTISHIELGGTSSLDLTSFKFQQISFTNGTHGEEPNVLLTNRFVQFPSGFSVWKGSIDFLPYENQTNFDYFENLIISRNASFSNFDKVKLFSSSLQAEYILIKNVSEFRIEQSTIVAGRIVLFESNFTSVGHSNITGNFSSVGAVLRTSVGEPMRINGSYSGTNSTIFYNSTSSNQTNISGIFVNGSTDLNGTGVIYPLDFVPTESLTVIALRATNITPSNFDFVTMLTPGAISLANESVSSSIQNNSTIAILEYKFPKPEPSQVVWVIVGLAIVAVVFITAGLIRCYRSQRNSQYTAINP